MKTISYLCLFAYFIFSCTSNSTGNSKAPSAETITEKKTDTLILIENQPQIDYSDSLNYIDSNNWKQGKHISKNQWGKIIEEATYNNDTIVGLFRFWDGMQKDGFYFNGKKHGNWNLYYENGTILLITHYENDSIIWHTPYIANKRFIIPIKDFTPVADSFYMKAPHPNGKLWYEGTFINKKPSGIHKVYRETGTLKGIIEYDDQIFSEYDSLGRFIKKDSIFLYRYSSSTK